MERRRVLNGDEKAVWLQFSHANKPIAETLFAIPLSAGVPTAITC